MGNGKEAHINPDKMDSQVPHTEKIVKVESEERRLISNRWGVVTALFILLPVILWQARYWGVEWALKTIEEQSARKLDLYAADLRSTIGKYSYLPRILAEDEDISNLLQGGEAEKQLSRVNRSLTRVNAFAGASATYVMAADGMTLASSNWDTPKSFVGKNFKFRPYFQMAMKGNVGRYFALGTTSNEPGYYLSYPIVDDDKINGAVVVKVGMDMVEKAWALDAGPVMVVDPNKVVIITNTPEWKFRTLGTLPDEEVERLKASRKYHTAPLEPLIFEEDENLTDGVRITRVGTRPTSSYLLKSELIKDVGWTLYVLAETTDVKRSGYLFMGIAGLLFFLFFFNALFMQQRRLRLQENLVNQQKVANALSLARDDLERRVQDRTQDLQTSNERLRKEIEDRILAEKELRRAQADLVQAEKMAVLGRISAGINHELNQPLGAIRSYSDNARAFLDRKRFGEARENMSAISGLTERMSEIIGRLRGFARKASDVTNNVSLLQALNNALALMEPRFKADDIDVDIKPCSGKAMVLGGEVRLEQVFVNLFTNASDSMAGSDSRRLTIEVTELDDWIVATVADTGPGIQEEDIQKIFDPFFTTKDVGKGLGLGLSIVFGIVNDFGGIISVENAPGGGAVFTLKLKPSVASGDRV